jgi:hypothetical protein
LHNCVSPRQRGGWTEGRQAGFGPVNGGPFGPDQRNDLPAGPIARDSYLFSVPFERFQRISEHRPAAQLVEQPAFTIHPAV